VGPLSPGQCDSGSTAASALPATGTFYLGAIVDEPGAIAELNETNNHTTGAPIAFGDGPDLVITAVSGPPSANAAFALASTVCNQGTRPSGGAELTFYASTDPTITSLADGPQPDVILGTRAVGPLEPGQCDDGPASAVPPSGPGAFYLGAVIDEAAQVGELIESNNHFTGPVIRFGDAPDLIITSISAPPSASGPFTIVATVCNQGTRPSGAVVTVYASFDPIITGISESSVPDDLLGSHWVHDLSPGQCATDPIDTFPLPAAGTFYLGAVVQADWTPELTPSNNHFTGPLIRSESP
jgi:subtilase family serine protease